MTVDQSPEERAVFTECRSARKYGRVITDGCAWTVASWYADRTRSASAGFAFLTTGDVSDPGKLFRDLTDNGARYVAGSARHRRALEQFAVYLLMRTEDGATPKWPPVWAHQPR